MTQPGSTLAPSHPRRRPRSTARPLKLTRAPGLDGLRVAGALGVVFYHALGNLRGSDAPAGVLLPAAAFTFFMISGYVIYRPFVAAHVGGTAAPPARRFWWSRIVRVLPLWWVAVAIYLVVDGTGSLRSVSDWALTLTLLQFLSRPVRYAVIGPAWALSVEWVFYLATPLLALATRAAHRRFAPRSDPLNAHLWVIGSIALVCSVYSPLRAFVAIAIGMALGVVDVRRHVTRRTPPWLRVTSGGGLSIVVTVVAGAVLLGYPYKPGLSVQWLEQDPTVVILWIAVATAWFVPVVFGPGTGPITSRLATPLAVRLSAATFGLYIWHDLVLRQVTERLGLDANVIAVLYLTMLGAAVLTAITYVAIERPTMAWRASWAGRSTGRPDAVPELVVPEADDAVADAGQPPTDDITTFVDTPADRPPDRRPSKAPRPAATAATAGTAASTARTSTAGSGNASPAGRSWIKSIDGLRVLAAVLVVSFHVSTEGGLAPKTLQSLAAVVIPVFSTFFVVSGFVLYRPWALAQARMTVGDRQRVTSPPDGGTVAFWLRRALRIYPLYWIVQGAAMAVSGVGDVHGVADWVQLITLFPLPDFGVIVNHGLGVVVWTLVVELGFYVVLPLLARAITGLMVRGTSFGAAQGIPLGILFVLLALGASTSARVLGVACCIVVGMALAAVDAWQRTTGHWVPAVKALARRPGVILPVVVGSWAIGTAIATDDDAGTLFQHHLGIHLALMVLVSTVLFVPAVFGSRRSRYRQAMSSPAMRILGPLTFGIYLWHYPVIRQTQEVVELPVLALLAWTLLVAGALAAVTFRVVEEPLGRLRHRRLGRTTAPVPRPADHALSRRTSR